MLNFQKAFGAKQRINKHQKVDDESKVDAEAAFMQDAKKAEAALPVPEQSMYDSKDDKSYLEDVVNLDDMTEEQKKQHEEQRQ